MYSNQKVTDSNYSKCKHALQTNIKATAAQHVNRIHCIKATWAPFWYADENREVKRLSALDLRSILHFVIFGRKDCRSHCPGGAVSTQRTDPEN